MIFSGLMINTGPWEKVTPTEKKKLKGDIPILNMCGFEIAGPYFRKINDDITIIFSNRHLERKCRGIDWGVLYPLEFLFDKTSNNSLHSNTPVPSTFALKPDLTQAEYFYYLQEQGITLTAVYRKEYYFQSLPLKIGLYRSLPDNGILVMMPIVG